MLLDLRRFPVRPKPKIGESLAGFFCRYFGANGHRIPARLLDAVRIVYLAEESPECHEAWTLISEVLDASTGERQKFWTQEWFQMIHVQTEPLKKHVEKIAARKFRFCPECLQSQNIHLAFWDLPLVFACPIHRCMLVTHCQCGMPLAWTNLVLSWTCCCGKFLPSVTAGFAHRSLIGGAKSVAAAITLPVPGLSYEEAQIYRLGRDLCSTYNVLIWLKLLLRRLRNALKIRLNIRMKTRAVEYWRYGSALEDWPNRLVNILQRLLIRFCRDDWKNSLVIHGRGSEAIQLLRMLDDALTDRRLPSLLRVHLVDLPTDYLLSSNALRDWIFNPVCSVSKRKRRLNTLRNWWSRLPERMEVSNERLPHEILRLQTKNQSRCAALLNGLAVAADRSMDPMRFRSLSAAWPAMPTDTSRLSATEFFELLAQRLLTVSSTHREYLMRSFLEAVDVTS